MFRAVSLFVVVLVMGCSKKDPVDSAKPETVPSTPAPSAGPAPTPPAKQLTSVKAFGSARMFAVGSAAIVCDGDCQFGKKAAPKVWLVHEGKVQEEPKLWPGHAWKQYQSALDEWSDGIAGVSYFGEYPKGLYANADTGSRVFNGLPTVKFVGKYWANSEKNWNHGGDVTLPPRKLDRALVTSPVTGDPVSALVHGGGGPTLAVSAKKLHTFVDDAWKTTDAPWGDSPKPRRLADGRTLVGAVGGVYLVDASGKVEAFEGAKPDTAQFDPLGLGEDVWFTAITPNLVNLSLLRAKDSSAYRLAKLEVREKPAEKKATESEPAEMPPPVKFTPECKTPFVQLATPPSLDHYFDTTAKGLAGHAELADKLTFVVFKRGTIVFFGAQAKDEASANALMKLVQANIPGMKPQLACLDAKAHIPDPYAPPPGMRVVFLHLGSGRQLRLQ